MSCSHCENSIKKSVGDLNGVYNITVDLKSKNVVVRYDSEKISSGDIKNVIEDQGYNVKFY